MAQALPESPSQSFFFTYGFCHVTMCDINGIISKEFSESELDAAKDDRGDQSGREKGTLADALKGADIFVGVSAPNIVTKEMVAFHESGFHPICNGKSGS